MKEKKEKEEKDINCEICGKEFSSMIVLSCHLTKEHQNISKKDYYDNFLKKEKEGECYFCGNEAIFKNITNGYHSICDCKDCLGKTRATGTYEFLMYKYNLTKDDAIKMMNERAEGRGEKIKSGLNKQFEKNENFFKEKSRQCVEYWLKNGYTQEDSEIEVKKTFDDIHTKTWKKRRENPELYQDVNTAQIKYWLKKGYSQEEAEIKLKNRQTTFSLNICIEKHGEVMGKEIWLDRQVKWSKNFKKSNFSKISQELYWSIYEFVKDDNDIYFATLKDGVEDNSGKNNEYRLQLSDVVILPDFFVKNKKRIIEFDGTYYHRDNPENKKRTQERDDSIVANNYDVFHVSEYDYNNNKQKVIQQCIDFINK